LAESAPTVTSARDPARPSTTRGYGRRTTRLCARSQWVSLCN
jgi:hypothetical protein